jgi:hypothetical protein
LLSWMKAVMLEQHGNISPHNLDLLKVADTADEVAAHVLAFYQRNPLQPNF